MQPRPELLLTANAWIHKGNHLAVMLFRRPRLVPNLRDECSLMINFTLAT